LMSTFASCVVVIAVIVVLATTRTAGAVTAGRLSACARGAGALARTSAAPAAVRNLVVKRICALQVLDWGQSPIFTSANTPSRERRTIRRGISSAAREELACTELQRGADRARHHRWCRTDRGRPVVRRVGLPR